MDEYGKFILKIKISFELPGRKLHMMKGQLHLYV